MAANYPYDLLDVIADQIQWCASAGYSLGRINVTKTGSYRETFAMGPHVGHDRSWELCVHPDDFEEWWTTAGRKQFGSFAGPNWPGFIWGVPVWVTDLPTPKPPEKIWLSLRYRNKGVKHSIDVIDEKGNKLGEVKGVRHIDFHADARGHAYYSIEVRVVDGGLDGP